MPDRRFVIADHHAAFAAAAREWIAGRAGAGAVIVAPTVRAGDELLYGAPGAGFEGIERFTGRGFAARLAEPAMAERGLAPVSSTGALALAVRVVFAALKDAALGYFTPVAAMPGFARAAASTLAEMRLEQISAAALEANSAPGRDLARLLTLYEAELTERGLADQAALLALAAHAARSEHRWSGKPLVLLCPRADTASHRALLEALLDQAPAVFAGTLRADRRAVETLEALLGPAEEPGTAAATALERIQRRLFALEAAGAARDDSFAFFSAPGESFECVEIARRLRSLAARGVPFDRVAILLRSPERYQALVEEALRRAEIPAWFSRGVYRPDPGGRAFVALLECALEGCTADRFAEYLSLGQLPALAADGSPAPSAAEWAGPAEAVLRSDAALPPAQEGPKAELTAEARPASSLAWERLLIDAAVVGGAERWRRRLAGLREELALRLADAAEGDPERARLERRIAQLGGLERFALPLIGMLDALPSSASWGEWLERLAALARSSLRHPEPVLALVTELEPMSEAGPVTLEEVCAVLSERLRFLRREPPEKPWGRVFVGTIEEASGRSFEAVFLPGLAEGLFPRRTLEDPLLLDAHRARLAPPEIAAPPDSPAREDGDTPGPSPATAKLPALTAGAIGESAGRAIPLADPTAPRAASQSLTLEDRRKDLERLLLHTAAASARSCLIASYPRIDGVQGRPRVPSLYALELARAAEGRLPDLADFERRAARAGDARLGWPAPSDPGKAIDDAEYDLATLARALALPKGRARGAARYLVAVSPPLARSLRSRFKRWEVRKWTDADGLVDRDSRDPDLEAVLAAQRLSARAYSPSSLQLFASCPYRFLLGAIHRLRPRERPEPVERMDALTRGALFHAIQFEFLRAREAARIPLKVANREDLAGLADRTADRVAADFEERLAPRIPSVWHSEVEALKADLRGWVHQLAVEASRWRPARYEYSFGLRLDTGHDPASTTREAVLFDRFRLRGSIDLIEEHADGDTLRVTDHKTSRAPEPKPTFVGGGLHLQPLLYALAASELLGAPVVSGRLSYCTERGGYQAVEIPVNELSTAALEQVLKAIDGSIGQGLLPAAPQPEACEHCDYRLVCGPYEELRTRRKPKDALELLNAVRGLP